MCDKNAKQNNETTHAGSVYTVIAITLERFSTLRSSGRGSKVTTDK